MASTDDEIIAVVDADNRFVRWEARGPVHRRELPHRSVHILLFDPEGRLLIQRRDRRKATHPGWWSTSAAGHVARDDYPAGPDERLDEVYAGVAERELEEELGVRTPLKLIGRFGPEPGVHYEWIHLFEGPWEGRVTPRAGEVEATRWVTLDELEPMRRGGEKLTPALRYFARWLTRR